MLGESMLTLGAIDAVPWPFYLAPIGGLAALATAKYISNQVMKRGEGDPEMIRIAEAVREGARAYLKSQYKVVGIVFAVLVLLLVILGVLGVNPIWTAVGVPVAGFLSAWCGWQGMKMATNASARTAAAARESLNSGLQVAFRAGAVMGLTCVGYAILDVSFWFFLFTAFGDALGLEGGLKVIAGILVSYKMGASLQALFARVGGGIFTKAADVGADLVGKVEAGIPEDDARNPATIADNVGDNVGDVAGMGADLYESYYSSIIAAISLGVAAAFSLLLVSDVLTNALALQMAVVPIALAGFGILASIVGVFVVKTKENASFHQLLNSLHMGVWVASALTVIAAFLVPFLLLNTGGVNDNGATLAFNEIDGVVPWWRFSLSIISGLAAGLVIAWWTEYCTSYEHAPTKRIAQQALTGPATVIISGIAEGMRSTWASLVAVVLAILLAYTFAGGNENFLMGLYGVGIAAVGMLSTLGITLATDAYGPIADNAGGNAEMSGQEPYVRERTDLLDSLGNTTAATGKGFAIGSAALTALALLAAYVMVVQTYMDSQAAGYARAQSAEVTGEIADGSYAIHEGHGRFGIVVPGAGENGEDYFGGAILLDRRQLTQQPPAEFADIPVGEPLPLFEAGHLIARELGRETAPTEELTRARDMEFELLIPTDQGEQIKAVSIVSTKRITIEDVLDFYRVTLTNPNLLGGLFIGVMLTFLFCALTMDAVGRAANLMMLECRRQFGIMRDAFRAQGVSEADIADPQRWPMQVESGGTMYPDYPRCVSIATAGAQREMVVPALLAVLVPVGAGLVLGVSGVMGILAGGLITGFAVAVFMANAGGAWDNAKKLLESYGRITADQALDDQTTREKIPAEVRDTILAHAKTLREMGQGDAYVYGKGSEDHKATVVGDTVGDPFKDTSGPSLNILIKLLSSVAVVAAGLTVQFGPQIGAWLGLS